MIDDCVSLQIPSPLTICCSICCLQCWTPQLDELESFTNNQGCLEKVKVYPMPNSRNGSKSSRENYPGLQSSAKDPAVTAHKMIPISSGWKWTFTARLPRPVMSWGKWIHPGSQSWTSCLLSNRLSFTTEYLIEMIKIEFLAKQIINSCLNPVSFILLYLMNFLF